MDYDEICARIIASPGPNFQVQSSPLNIRNEQDIINDAYTMHRRLWLKLDKQIGVTIYQPFLAANEA